MKKLTTWVSTIVLAAAASQASAATYTIAGGNPSGPDASVVYNGLSIPIEVVNGSYDSMTGLGNWALDIDLSVFARPTMSITQNFTLDAGTLQGTLSPYSTCTGPHFSTCWSLEASFQGAFRALSPIADGLNTFEYYSSNLDGWVPFSVSLTEQVSEVPVPAAVWLFGSALLGLGGVARRRKAA